MKLVKYIQLTADEVQEAFDEFFETHPNGYLDCQIVKDNNCYYDVFIIYTEM